MPTTLVQLTDLHLVHDGGRALGVPTSETLAEILELVDREAPSLLLLTGDLAHDERAPPYDTLVGLLGDRVERVRLIPGNHDVPEAIRASFPDSFEPGASRTTFAERAGAWLILGLDSHVPGSVAGRLDDGQVAWLAERLDAHDGPAILFLHHPPAPIGTAWLDVMGLQETDALRAVLRERSGQVRAIFAGHVHQEAGGEVERVPVFTTPSTAFQFAVGSALPALDDRPPGFRVIELDDEPAMTTRVVRAPSLRFAPAHPGPDGY